MGQLEKAIQLRDSAWTMRFEEISQEKNNKIAELEVSFSTAQKEAEIVRLSLANDLNAANLARSRNAQIGLFTAGSLIIISLIIFFTQRSKKMKAEREAQELQVEAMKKRFMELHSSPAELAVDLDLTDLNNKLNTPLTEREFDALRLSIEGKTNTEIAESLFISVSTVKFHLRNTYSKMGVGNRKEAFQYMLKTY
jgi:ATP/maltotriose-dependent transcriptional regulator MalT